MIYNSSMFKVGFLIFFLSLNAPLFAQWVAQSVPRNDWPESIRSKAKGMPSMSLLQFSQEGLSQSPKEGLPLAPKSLGLPTLDSPGMQIEIKETELLVPEFSIELSSGTKYSQPLPSFYEGSVVGQKSSKVALMKTDLGWEGSIQTDTDHWTVGQLRKIKGAPYVMYKTSEETEGQPIACLGEQSVPLPDIAKGKISAPATFGSCRTVTVFLETDHFTYQAWGSNPAYVASQILATFHQVSQLYAQDGILLQLSGLKIWDTPDPWAGLSTPLSILTAVQNYYNNIPGSFPGTLHHFVSAKNLGGGVAYLYTGQTPVFGGMGERAIFAFGFKNASFGVSGNIRDQITLLPTYSWSVNVIAHEIGHNFGLPHTHSCSWPGGAIDNCGPTAGYDYEGGPCLPSPTAPVDGGTIMSYCHLVGGVGVNFARGFGPLPSQKMLAEVNAAVGLSSVVAPPIAEPKQKCFPASFTLVAAGCQGGTYRWYNQATGGTLLASGASFTTPVVSTTTAYFVDCTYEDCGTSTRRQVNVIIGEGVMPTPEALVNLACNVEVGTVVSVGGDCPSAQVQWLNSADATQVLGTGTSLTVSPYRNKTTYFAQCAALNNCTTSPRIPVENVQISNCSVCTLPSLNCSEKDVITRFTIRDGQNQIVYDRSSGCDPNGSSRDQSTIPILHGGQTYTLIIRNDQSFYPNGLRVWMGGMTDVDWVSLGHRAVGTWSVDTIRFTIPTQVPSGQRRIRAHIQYDRLPTAACRSTNFTGLDVYGEWEEVLVYVCPSQTTYSVLPNPASGWVFQEGLQTLEVSANLQTTRGKLTAGQSIEFKPGFEVQSGGVYLAQTNLGCPLVP